MDVKHFEAGMTRIYSIFGKSAPKPEVLEAVWDRVHDMPDAFLDYAIVLVRDEDMLPRNLGKYLDSLKPEFWSQKNGGTGKKEKQLGCRDCYKSPGWIYMYAPQTHYETWFPCACGLGETPYDIPRTSKATLRKHGYTDDPQGPVPGMTVAHRFRYGDGPSFSESRGTTRGAA